MAWNPRINAVEIGVDRILKNHAACPHGLHRDEDIGCTERYMLDALTLIVPEEFFDLAVIVLALIQRNSNLAAGAGHGLGDQASLGSLDVKIADLAEIEDLFVEIRPGRHLAAKHIVRQVIEIGQAARIGGHLRCRPGDWHEVHVIDLLGSVTINQIEI